MTQYIIDIGAVPDDGQGSPLRTAFDYTNENFAQIFAAGPVGSNVQIGNTTITTNLLNSNLILSPSGIGRVQFNNTLFPRLDDSYSIGTPSLRFNSIYLGTGGINTTGGITTTGNITAGYFIGNGSQLTGIVTSGNQIFNGNSSVVVAANGNVSISSAGVSNVAVFAPTGVYVAGEVSATGNVSGNYFIGNGSQLTGVTASAVDAIDLLGNTLSSNVVFSSLTSVGTLTSLSVSGNVVGGNILSDNYYYANGVPVPAGIIYTADTAPPGTAKVGDQWWDTTSSVLYEYINDGTSDYWVDTTSPAFAGGVVANVAISGTLVPVANVTFDIGTSGVYFRNTYTQNLYTNNRLLAKNMPLGAVVQTVMSSSLGGSATNSTTYADISYANVSITPSNVTSKIMVVATGTTSFGALAGANVTADTQLVRSPSISLQVQTLAAAVSGGGIGTTGAVSYSYIDAPGTTSPVTYKLQQRVSNASSTLTSTNIWLIAMEIAA